MYERMLNKAVVPEVREIEEYIGTENCERIQMLEDMLRSRYDLNRELRFPFGNSYGWGYKYSHKSKHLFYLFFEKGAMTVMMQIGDREVPLLNAVLSALSPKAQSLWENRYPCGDQGGWINYRILSDSELDEIIKLIEIKKKPAYRKEQP